MTGSITALWDREIDQHGDICLATQEACSNQFVALVKAARKSLSEGGTLFLFGNGGSAADAQHIAAELVGEFEQPGRPPMAAVALTTDSSLLTAIANDFGFATIFERQIRALGTPGDLAIGISTSGNSHNVIAAIRAASRDRNMATALLTGSEGGGAAGFADIVLKVPSINTARIQEMHILIGHMLCAALEGGEP